MYYPFEKLGWVDANWTIHPNQRCVVARINANGLWRCGYAVGVDEPTEKVEASLAENLKQRMPGHPAPDEYKIHRINDFQYHQRLAEKMRVRRFCLVGDAAHLCITM